MPIKSSLLFQLVLFCCPRELNKGHESMAFLWGFWINRLSNKEMIRLSIHSAEAPIKGHPRVAETIDVSILELAPFGNKEIRWP